MNQFASHLGPSASSAEARRRTDQLLNCEKRPPPRKVLLLRWWPDTLRYYGPARNDQNGSSRIMTELWNFAIVGDRRIQCHCALIECDVTVVLTCSSLHKAPRDVKSEHLSQSQLPNTKATASAGGSPRPISFSLTPCWLTMWWSYRLPRSARLGGNPIQVAMLTLVFTFRTLLELNRYCGNSSPMFSTSAKSLSDVFLYTAYQLQIRVAWREQAVHGFT
ncbi:hypothetical protein RRG08_006368 [Elysia crispata]|uniref:Uncharacterized protein n=1 Tax=Elysia crispata TaxID=231223 RepID=A0AAE0Z9P9_9GAST|nr:hypothetical protein RRG08_006368 [Elysia crispata]